MIFFESKEKETNEARSRVAGTSRLSELDAELLDTYSIKLFEISNIYLVETVNWAKIWNFTAPVIKCNYCT